MSKSNLEKRSISQRIGIKKRFPQLPDDIIQSSWSGIVSRTRNSSQIFEKINDNVFAAGCYNGSGIGVGTLFGEQIAIQASQVNTKEIEIIEAKSRKHEAYSMLLDKNGSFYIGSSETFGVYLSCDYILTKFQLKSHQFLYLLI